jgi:hypothetical protein
MAKSLIKKDFRNRLLNLKNEIRKPPVSFLAIDPGNIQSAFCFWNKDKPVSCGIERNEILLDRLDGEYSKNPLYPGEHVVIEMPCDMGSSFDSLFETAFWTGMFVQVCDPTPYTLVYRFDVWRALKAQNDTSVRAALLKRFGKSIELKFAYDEWSALAIAVTFADHCRLVF